MLKKSNGGNAMKDLSVAAPSSQTHVKIERLSELINAYRAKRKVDGGGATARIWSAAEHLKWDAEIERLELALNEFEKAELVAPPSLGMEPESNIARVAGVIADALHNTDPIYHNKTSGCGRLSSLGMEQVDDKRLAEITVEFVQKWRHENLGCPAHKGNGENSLICKVLQEHPVHCEDCSVDCENHEGPECTPIYVLHAKLRKALAGTPVAAPSECGQYCGRSPDGPVSLCKKPKGHDGSCNPLHGLTFAAQGWDGEVISATKVIRQEDIGRGGTKRILDKSEFDDTALPAPPDGQGAKS